jgi:hypothetical protein
VKTRGGMPSPYNTNEFILAEHADETTRKLGQNYFYYFYLHAYFIPESTFNEMGKLFNTPFFIGTD